MRNEQPFDKLMRNMGGYILMIVVTLMIINSLQAPVTPKQELSYSDFLAEVAGNKLAQVTLTNTKIEALRKDSTEFVTIAPSSPNIDITLMEKLQEHKVTIVAKNPPEAPWWLSLATSLLPVLLILGGTYFVFQQVQSGGSRLFSFGRSHARATVGSTMNVNFGDVAGADEAKQELQEIVEFLKHPTKFRSIGARIPKGVLLFGAPGTGKTLLARAVAGEAGVPFFSISGSDFVEMFVGVGASRVRDLFEQAKHSAPCIVFIDEIDAVGRQRGAGLGGGHDEREQTLNQLLVEMDGFSANQSIIIIAATNRPDILDPALLRPGRFDRQIVVDKPDLRGRLAILKVHSKGKPLDRDVDLEILARRTPGFTGADLSNLVNEAALLSARQNRDTISMSSMEEAIERVMAGPERKSHIMSDKEKRLTAYHEAGHALIGMLLPNADPVHKVTIIPRGRAGGYTLMLPKEDRSYQTRSELLDQIKTLLAGRVAEEVVLKEISTGAQSDIKKASALVRSMVTQYGMSELLGPISFGEGPEHQVFLGRDFNSQRNYSEDVAGKIDSEVTQCIEASYSECRQLMVANLDTLHRLARALLEQETLDADELADITGIKRAGDKAEDIGLKNDAEDEPAPPLTPAPVAPPNIIVPDLRALPDGEPVPS